MKSAGRPSGLVVARNVLAPPQHRSVKRFRTHRDGELQHDNQKARDEKRRKLVAQMSQRPKGD